MQTFILQVQLDDDSTAAEDRLNEVMEAYGFVRAIRRYGSLQQSLPPGYFCKVSALSEDEVRVSAETAASLAAVNFTVTISQADESAWMGVDFVNGLVWEPQKGYRMTA